MHIFELKTNHIMAQKIVRLVIWSKSKFVDLKFLKTKLETNKGAYNF